MKLYKKQYQKVAISTMKVNAEMGNTFATIINCLHPFSIDQPKMSGGNDEGPNPLEVFLSTLSTLPACICAIGRIIAMQRRIKLRGISVDIEGDIDKDFLLGKTTEGRAGFTEIRSFVTIDADMTSEEKEAFLHDVEMRCPIADNITHKSVIKPVVVEDATV